LAGRLGSNGGTSTARASAKHASQTTAEPTATFPRIAGFLLAIRDRSQEIERSRQSTGSKDP
jgi:hypothetical protein